MRACLGPDCEPHAPEQQQARQISGLAPHRHGPHVVPSQAGGSNTCMQVRVCICVTRTGRGCGQDSGRATISMQCVLTSSHLARGAASTRWFCAVLAPGHALLPAVLSAPECGCPQRQCSHKTMPAHKPVLPGRTPRTREFERTLSAHRNPLRPLTNRSHIHRHQRTACEHTTRESQTQQIAECSSKEASKRPSVTCVAHACGATHSHSLLGGRPHTT